MKLPIIPALDMIAGYMGFDISTLSTRVAHIKTEIENSPANAHTDVQIASRIFNTVIDHAPNNAKIWESMVIAGILTYRYFRQV